MDPAAVPLQLDLGEFTPPLVDPTLTIQERFERFDAANPWVRQALVRLARDAQRRGRRYGCKALYERLRWEYDLTTSGEPFVLNNDFTSRFARLIAQTEPDLRDFFRTRELRAA